MSPVSIYINSSSNLEKTGYLIFILGIYHSSIFLMSFGTLINGFSLNTAVHRQYLLYFIPKRKMNKYLLYFKIIVLLGNASGPLLGLISLYIFPENFYQVYTHRIFNEYSFPAWCCFFASIFFL